MLHNSNGKSTLILPECGFNAPDYRSPPWRWHVPLEGLNWHRNWHRTPSDIEYENAEKRIAELEALLEKLGQGKLIQLKAVNG